MLAGMLHDVIDIPSAHLNILDLGCGTGLFGIEIKNIKKKLVGIDLAPRMIQKARERELYDQLIVGDLLEYMAEFKPDEFDLIAATDVFIYVGNLQPVFEQVSRILPIGGLFTFSLESTQKNVGGFTLDKTGRYTHGSAYVTQLCAEHGLVEQKFEQATLRMAEGKPVWGYLYLLKKV
jgi:predicted TPR repeat methyltransferase